MTIKNWVFSVLLALPASGLVSAEDEVKTAAGEKTELGVVIGRPSGISGKFFLSEKDAVDAVIGYGSKMMFHADYLRHDFNAFKVTEGRMPLYYGAGLLIKEKNFYAQVKIGFEYLFETNPLGLFLEIAPAIGADFDFQGGVGARYRLK